MLRLSGAPARRHAADDAVPDADRLLSRQSRAESEEARDQPDRDARHLGGARELARQERLPPPVPRALRACGSGCGPRSRASIPTTGAAAPALLLVRRAADAGRSPACSRAISAARPSSRSRSSHKLWPALQATGILMFWVMVVMIPVALFDRRRLGHARRLARRPRRFRSSRSRPPRRRNMCPASSSPSSSRPGSAGSTARPRRRPKVI